MARLENFTKKSEQRKDVKQQKSRQAEKTPLKPKLTKVEVPPFVQEAMDTVKPDHTTTILKGSDGKVHIEAKNNETGEIERFNSETDPLGRIKLGNYVTKNIITEAFKAEIVQG